MSKNNGIILDDIEIYKIKKLATETRQFFGVQLNVPIGNDIRLLLDKKDILLCEYPFSDTNGTHTYGNITWFKAYDDTITFIGLNTSSFYDEQIFAIAHEIYHYTTKSGKAYTPDIDYEDKVIEKKADRFAAELLLPDVALKEAVMNAFTTLNITNISENRLLRFIARVQCDWWLPFQAIINRLFEGGYISEEEYDKLFVIDCRNGEKIYRRLLRSIDPEISELLNKKTRNVGVSNKVIETIISNYEDGLIEEDELVHALKMFGKKPVDYGISMNVEIDEELKDFFESEDD